MDLKKLHVLSLKLIDFTNIYMKSISSHTDSQRLVWWQICKINNFRLKLIKRWLCNLFDYFYRNIFVLYVRASLKN